MEVERKEAGWGIKERRVGDLRDEERLLPPLELELLVEEVEDVEEVDEVEE